MNPYYTDCITLRCFCLKFSLPKTYWHEKRGDENEEDVIEEKTGEEDGADLQAGQSDDVQHVNAERSNQREGVNRKLTNLCNSIYDVRYFSLTFTLI